MKKFYPIVVALIGTYFISGNCKKDNPPADPCAGVTITVAGTVQDASSANNGSITITSPTGSGFTYQLNNGAAGSSATFSNLAPGQYTVTVKNANGCSGTKQFVVNSDACAGKNITVGSSNVLGTTPCTTTNDGSVTVTASGSTGFTYNINGGSFQAGATFGSLAAGTYTIGAKDVDGCIKTASVTISPRPAGPLFTAVRDVINANCVGCHGATNPSGGVSLNTDCAIVQRKDRIKARSVDGMPSWMPTAGPMPISERNKITNWINAGGRVTD
jgi:mono/diheme cytochrome c family protein